MTAQRPSGPGSPPRRGALPQNVLAKALYDNVAESPDELSFRKGDIMTVLERNTQGLDGWWLCSLHGRQGIVPGNRLKLLVGMYEKKQQQQQQQQQAPSPAQGQAPAQPLVPPPALPYLHPGGYAPPAPAAQYTPMHPAYGPQGDSVYLMPVPGKGQQGLYPAPTGQFPPAAAKQPLAYPKQTPPHAGPGQEIYQVPPSLGPAAEAYPGGSASPPQDLYQVPPPTGQAQDIYQVPPSLDARSWEGHKSQGKVGRGSWGGWRGALWSTGASGCQGRGASAFVMGAKPLRPSWGVGWASFPLHWQERAHWVGGVVPLGVNYPAAWRCPSAGPRGAWRGADLFSPSRELGQGAGAGVSRPCRGACWRLPVGFTGKARVSHQPVPNMGIPCWMPRPSGFGYLPLLSPHGTARYPAGVGRSLPTARCPNRLLPPACRGRAGWALSLAEARRYK